jgi:hypothetical protein
MRRILCTALLLHLTPAFPDDGLGNAYVICDIFERTRISTECKASNATSTVDVIIATSETEAAKVCALISDKMVQMKRPLGGQWQLRIFAPDRADQPLAACPLR